MVQLSCRTSSCAGADTTRPVVCPALKGLWDAGATGEKGDKGEPSTPAPFPSNVIIAAKGGGHFISVQAAINSITDASDSNRYLIWIGPGTYNE